MPPVEPFRLLDLPREVRDEIYYDVLCVWPTQDTFKHRLMDNQNLNLEVRTPKIEPTILLTNKAIYHEAKQVLLKGNKFVHIKMTAKDPYLLSGAFLRSEVPVVAAGKHKCTPFKDLVVMKHSINFPDDPSSFPRARVDVILLHRDLTDFCQGVALVDVHSRRFAGQSTHTIHILDPFAATHSPDYLNLRNQERLMKPQLAKLRGFDNVKIRGNVDRNLARAVVRTMNLEEALPSPTQLLEKLISWKNRGDQAVLNRDPLTAIVFWNVCILRLLSARNRRAWPGFIEAAGTDYADHLSDVAFEIQRSRAQAYIQLAQTQQEPVVGDPDYTFETWIKQIYNACHDALQMGRTLGTDWTASDDQQATILYYWAKGHRLAEEDVHFAEDAICRAAQFRPGDQEILDEMRLILEWKDRVGLP